MLNVTVTGYTQACEQNSGGIARLFVGDAEDFNFTSGTPDALTGGYAAIARRTGATDPDGDLFEIGLQDETGTFKMTQSITNGSSQWAFEITGQLLKVQQSLSKFVQMLDGVNLCNGQLVWVIVDNNTKVWVVGEKYVDGTDSGKKFKVKQDGTVLDFGKLISDFNGATLSAKGNFTRPAYEFKGLFSAISAMTTAP